MCPPASISPRLDINVSSSDEEVLLFLGRRKAGDPVPSNIITEVNPFSVEPWDSPEGMWYLYNLEDACSSSHRSAFKEAHIGYWSFMDHLTIYRGKVAAGRKTTWEFFIGREPLGNRTGWLMYDYQRVQKACQGIRAAQDCSSMCRVFLQEDQREIIGDRKSPDTERRGSNSAGERGESMLLRFLESEETSPRANAVNKFELGAPEPSPDRSIHDLITGDDSAPDLNPFVEFSKGEYLALEDLYGPESTSSTSDDSSFISTNSDECFDPEALLRDLDNVKASAKPAHPAAIRPFRSAGSNEIDNGGHRSADGELVLANSPPSDGSEQQPFSAGTAACSRRRGHPKRTHSGRSESSSSSNGPGSKSVGRIAKLGKKYCCFATSPAD